MNTLLYECFAGISGDMNIGAMVDLGADFKKIKSELSKLGLDHEFSINVKKADKHGIFGSKIYIIDHNHHHVHSHVAPLKKNKLKIAGLNKVSTAIDQTKTLKKNKMAQHDHSHEHLRNYRDIVKIIQNSTLSARVKCDSLGIFDIIAKAEAKMHNKPIDEVHFHEVGAIDSIVDVVATAICMEQLEVARVYTTPIEVGSGFVKCAHGMMPIPAPATAEILTGLISQSKVKGYEMTTPTGAAILKYYVKDCVVPEVYQSLKVGYGVGTRDIEIPNLLRASLIKTSIQSQVGRQYFIETNIDDSTAENIAFVERLLLEAGAKDVFKTPIVMKKGRSAVKLSVLSNLSDKEKLLEIIYRHTSSIGARGYVIDKYALDRKIVYVDCDYGTVRVKVSYFSGEIVNVKPEYDDCIEICKKHNLSLSEVQNKVLSCFVG